MCTTAATANPMVELCVNAKRSNEIYRPKTWWSGRFSRDSVISASFSNITGPVLVSYRSIVIEYNMRALKVSFTSCTISMWLLLVSWMTESLRRKLEILDICASEAVFSTRISDSDWCCTSSSCELLSYSKWFDSAFSFSIIRSIGWGYSFGILLSGNGRDSSMRKLTRDSLSASASSAVETSFVVALCSLGLPWLIERHAVLNVR